MPISLYVSFACVVVLVPSTGENAQVLVVVVLFQGMHMCNKLHFYINNRICKPPCFCKIF
jgi:hypothetical protein